MNTKILGLPTPTLIEWICLCVGLFLSIRYSTLIDDSFIYFRYVDNLVYLGEGLVYNRGEFVEGFSSPLWVITLTCLRYLHLNFWIIIKLLSALSLIVCWILLIILNRKLSGEMTKSGIINFPMIHLLLSYSVLSSFTTGLETPFIQLCGVAYATFLLYPNSIILQIIVGLSPLVRHELVIPFIIVFVWYCIARKRIPVPLLITGFVFTGSWLMFRIYYYADLLPNTFYLKDDVAIHQGLLYVQDTIIPYCFHYIMIFFILCFMMLRIFEKRGAGLFTSQRALMLCIGLSVTAYVVKIGGTYFHYRYLAFPYCIMICATGGLLERLIAMLNIQRYKKALVFFSLTVLLYTATRYPGRLIDRHPFFDDIDISQYHNYNRIETGPGTTRYFWDITPARWGSGKEIEFSEGMKFFRKYYGSSYYRDVMTAMTCNCSCAHEKFDYQIIHGFGLTEPFLARTHMFAERPAHKLGLFPLSEDIAEIRKKYGFQKGAFRKAIEDGDCPEWVRKNIDVIERIEQKVYNQHNFLENIRLASIKVGRINP